MVESRSRIKGYKPQKHNHKATVRTGCAVGSLPSGNRTIILYVWPTALRLIEHLVFIIRHECATNVYWNAHFCLHNFHTRQLSSQVSHLSFHAFHLSFHARKRLIYWSKEWGKGSGESVGDCRVNHKLQCSWNVVFEGIIEGLGNIVINSLVKSWRKVLHSIGYSMKLIAEIKIDATLTIYQCCILDSTSQVFFIGPLVGWWS